ncbi:MAG: SapC family protein, partial [Pseudomonadota bacterium]
MENTLNPQPNAQQPELTGNVLFYKNPQPLNPEQHAGLGVKQIDQPFGFLRQAHAIPVTVTEFGMAAAAYPIIFVGDEFTPVAVMGIRQNENLFVRDDGSTEPDFYVPAFVRRYPFVFANDNQSDRLLLCIDRDAPMVTNQPDVALFENGEPTPFTQNAIEFCKEF